MHHLPIGTPVLAYPGVRPEVLSDAKVLDTVTRSEVWHIGIVPVVSVEGYPGGIALTHIDVKDEAEHTARVVSDQAMTHIPPNYTPAVSDALTVARLINGSAS